MMFITCDCFHQHSGLSCVFGGIVSKHGVVQQSVSSYSAKNIQNADYLDKYYAFLADCDNGSAYLMGCVRL